LCARRVTRELGVRMVRLVATALVVSAAPALVPAGAGAATRTEDVLLVSNNWAGTADVVNPRTFHRLARINVIPDLRERVAEIESEPAAKFFYDTIKELVGEGHHQYVDDGFTSRDGRFVYFSRPSLADVVAIDLRTRKIAWRVPVDGYRADHMAISPNGRRLLVSRRRPGWWT
jgi:hypothetical protein